MAGGHAGDAAVIACAEAAPCAHAVNALCLARHLDECDLDAAIEAGLMTFAACSACSAGTDDLMAALVRIADARRRVRVAWDARDRYLHRHERIERRNAERAARRVLRTTANSPARSSVTSTLPPAAAAALARAKARAAAVRS